MGKTELDARSGAGVWFGENHPNNKAIKVPGTRHSNQIGELTAVLYALQNTPNFAPMRILTDSRYVIEGLTVHLHNWEDSGWINVSNKDLFKAITYHLRTRSAPTSFEWVKGHSDNHGNEQADKLALEGAQKDIPDDLDITIPPAFDLQGARIASLSQSTAYQGIRQQKTEGLNPRRRATIRLDMTRGAIQTYTHQAETDETIWTGSRHNDLNITVKQFLFKAIHDTHRIGQYWDSVTNYEHRARCGTCNDPNEDLEHVLLTCTSPARPQIWEMARKLWPYPNNTWPDMHLGTILGCRLLTTEIENDDNISEKDRKTATRGPSRLLRILISEAAHLIWVLRCEKIIQGRNHSTNEIQRRWYNKISNRLNTDRVTAAKINRKPGHRSKVKQTWEKLLTQENDLPADWAHNLEVLVSIEPP